MGIFGRVELGSLNDLGNHGTFPPSHTIDLIDYFKSNLFLLRGCIEYGRSVLGSNIISLPIERCRIVHASMRQLNGVIDRI